MEQKWKTFFLWAAICMMCFVGIPIHLKGQDSAVLEATFKNYSTNFNKSYTDEEFTERLGHFKRAVQRIHDLNAEQNLLMSSSASSSESGLGKTGGHDHDHDHHHRRSHNKWKPGMPKNQGAAHWGFTQFADMSPEEFQTKYLDPKLLGRILKRQQEHKLKHHEESNSENEIHDDKLKRRKRALLGAGLPVKVDWRAKGVVTPIKHQKNCGACWAFSTIETVESMHALQKGSLQSLSVQQVIDCATNGNQGCNGGDTCAALSWMTSRKLATESVYPTTLRDDSCRTQSALDGPQVAANYTCENLDGQEAKVMSILANHGPVVAAVDATNWQFYVGGIIQWNCDANNNHAVQIVGYDNTAVPPHYIVRNSWGSSFGDNGYLYVAIGSNLCGIAREVSSLTVK